MNWRWLILDFIPTEFELTRAQRRHVRGFSIILPRARLIFASCTLFSFVPASVLHCGGLLSIARGSLPSSFILFVLAGPIAAYFIWIGLMVAFYRPFVLRALELYLRDCCGKCGYDLNGLDETILKCPECGQSRRIVPPDTQCVKCYDCGFVLTGLPDEITFCPKCGNTISD